jgi:hypothetical protein
MAHLGKRSPAPWSSRTPGTRTSRRDGAARCCAADLSRQDPRIPTIADEIHQAAGDLTTAAAIRAYAMSTIAVIHDGPGFRLLGGMLERGERYAKRAPLLLRTYVHMGRDRQGNSRASDECNRLMMALRGRKADRVLNAARTLQDPGEFTLGDAAYACAFFPDVDGERYPVAAARLATRIAMASRLGLEDLDRLMDLVANLRESDRLAELLRFTRDADLAPARARTANTTAL